MGLKLFSSFVVHPPPYYTVLEGCYISILEKLFDCLCRTLNMSLYTLSEILGKKREELLSLYDQYNLDYSDGDSKVSLQQ